jgi:2'-hydroxybiphenyl-2-sulfinate desulfinase
LARESNSSEFWVAAAYGADAHLRLRTNLDELSITALQDFTNFLHRWHFIPNAVDVRGWLDPRAFHAVLEARRGAAAA